MSLLLDALKKAAEQKARKAEEADETTQASSDTVLLEKTETYVTGSDDSIKGFEERTFIDADDSVIAEDNSAIFEENTELLQEDETDLDLFREDETELSQVDSTEVFQEDETEMSQEDETEISQEDETEISQEDETEISQVDSTEVIQEDETEISQVDETHVLEEKAAIKEEETELNIVDTGDETVRPSFDEDETMSLLSNEDVSEFLGDFDALAADSSQQPAPTEANVQPREEDISLTLIDDSDDTTVQAPDESTVNNTSLELLSEGDSTTTAGLELVDYDEAKDESTARLRTVEEATITAGVELESLRNENTIIRQDATSTHTYAPDNYDRTLIKPANDDASRIFAGMKSEDDVLMTPDYAKRVFLSKSSANRVQHYKIYVGIAASIFLAIGIFSLFELQNENERIDTALAPLKRDPMPGVIQNSKTGTNLFEKTADSGIDSQTLKIVKSASLSSSDIESEKINETVVVDNNSNIEPIESTQIRDAASDVETDGSQQAASAAVEEKPLVISSRTTETKSARVKKQSTQSNSKTTLEITTSSQYTDKDRWLKEAYQAYQRGDDETALRKYNQVLNIDSGNRNALLARAAIAIQNNNSASAIKDYQKLLLSNPKDSLAMSSLIAVANLSPEKSESQLKLMIREEPNSPYLNFVLGNIYGAQNRWQEAQSLYFKALENNPDDPNYAYNLAVSLEHLAKPGVAIAYYEKALVNIGNSLATFNKDVVDRRLEMLRQL